MRSLRDGFNIALVFGVFYGTVLTTPQGRAASEIEDLQTLVNINSGSDNPDGVNRIQDWLADRLKRNGFEITFKSNGGSKTQSGKLLVATLTGSDPHFITLVMHADTVFERSHPFQSFKFSHDGNRATGPGVIDDKGGMLVALNGLESLLKAGKKPKHSIRVVSSPSEETGSGAFLDDFKNFSKDSWMVLGFEPALDDGSIVESRRGTRWYHLHATGKEAHAGRAHADGINACQELADKLSQLSKLTDYASDVTVSIGRMVGGQDKFNIVCGSAEAKIDTRFADLKSRDLLHKKIDEILKHPIAHSKSSGQLVQLSYTLDDDTPPFSASKQSRRYVDRMRKIIGDIEGKQPGAKISGGAADSNAFSREGLIIIDGLGPVGSKMHTSEESILLSSLKSRAQGFAGFLESVW